jgi:hypothetical protein
MHSSKKVLDVFGPTLFESSTRSLPISAPSLRGAFKLQYAKQQTENQLVSGSDCNRSKNRQVV